LISGKRIRKQQLEAWIIASILEFKQPLVSFSILICYFPSKLPRIWIYYWRLWLKVKYLKRKEVEILSKIFDRICLLVCLCIYLSDDDILELETCRRNVSDKWLFITDCTIRCIKYTCYLTSGIICRQDEG
jgi:hypothetical protein